MTTPVRRRKTVDVSDITCRYRQCGQLDRAKATHYDGCEREDPEHCYGCQLDAIADAACYDDEDSLIHFADPGGRSSLRATNVITICSRSGRESILCPSHGCHTRVSFRDSFCRNCGMQLYQRNQDCPDCGAKDVLTAEDRQLGYRCNRCADAAEMGWAI